MPSTDKTIAVFPPQLRTHLEGRLPDWIEPHWFSNSSEALTLAPQAEIGWFDMANKTEMAAVIMQATRMRWLNSALAGMDGFPLATLKERQAVVTNGAGINAITIAEYALLGMLTIAKGYREVLRAQDLSNWIAEPPGKLELYGSHALIVGYGAIGKLLEERLKAFQVKVTAVRRTSDPSGKTLGPNDWQSRLGEFDWVILSLPATSETTHLMGAPEFRLMKKSAVLMNFARGSIVDQPALISALQDKTIAAAFLDVTDPEPLPPDNPLWKLDNAYLSMHLSGRSQTQMPARSADRFLENLQRYRDDQALKYQVNLDAGY